MGMGGTEWIRGIGFIWTAYALGSVPSGYLIVKWTRGVDIRSFGSGNIGATNVQRYLGSMGGGVTFLLDAVKGALAVWLVARFVTDGYWVHAAAFFVVLGHTHSMFLMFRGGKGVATGCGAFLVLCPNATLAALGVFILVLVAGRIVSLASITAAVALSLFAGWWYGKPELYTALLVGSLVLLRHGSNFRNLFHRRESRVGEDESVQPARSEGMEP